MTTHQALSGKVALITGAGSGIGQASAIRLAKAGASIGVLGRTGSELEETCRAIEKAGGQCLAIEADVAEYPQIVEAVRKLEQQFHRLDIVFANAGINGVWAPISELEPDEWEKTLRVNLSGTFHTVKASFSLLQQRGGSVIICSSVNGTRMFSNTGATAYACSKGAQVVFARMTALEFAKHRIRVNSVLPGAIETSIEDSTQRRHVEKEKEPVEFPEGAIPLTDGEPGMPEQVAEAVLFLASDSASHITGVEIFVDGGQSLLQG